jgi:tetratricopeptide (TPR) repeat protein
MSSPDKSQTGPAGPDIVALRQAVAASPRDAQAHFLLGNALWAAGAREEAVGLLAGAVALDGKHFEARNNLGNALAALGRFDEALAQYRDALVLRPDAAEPHYNLGNALLAAGRPDEAASCFHAALARKPDHAGAHNNLGNTLRAAGQHEAAIECYQRALALRPEYFGTLNNIGSALIALHRPEEALDYLRRSLQARPDYAEACNNLGGALLALGRPEQAAEWFARATALDPGQLQARFGEGLARLSLGDFARGWPAYEARWQDPGFLKDTPNFARPPWRGHEDVAGRTMLLHAEQGLGDSIQFVRYVPLLRRRGARVVLAVQAPLVALLRDLADDIIADDIIADGKPPPPHDLRCPLLSLPLAFATDLATIPADIPYIRATPDRVDAWTRRLGARTRRRVGVAWSGSPEHPEDAIRSIPAAALLAALARRDVELHVVQKDIRDTDVSAAAGARLHVEALTDFAETAALLSCLDLVITVDTSVAHLAGAMGVPTWILLQAGADFRWLRNRSDSPWYPTARLFRQPRAGDWAPVLAEVANALASVRRS